MKKVTFFQAKDGSNWPTAKECQAQDRKLKLAPAIDEFVASLKFTNGAMIDAASLGEFILSNADAITKALTEPLITRRPRKKKHSGDTFVTTVNGAAV